MNSVVLQQIKQVFDKDLTNAALNERGYGLLECNIV
jgi:hypothetical protein